MLSIFYRTTTKDMTKEEAMIEIIKYAKKKNLRTSFPFKLNTMLSIFYRTTTKDMTKEEAILSLKENAPRMIDFINEDRKRLNPYNYGLCTVHQLTFSHPVYFIDFELLCFKAGILPKFAGSKHTYWWNLRCTVDSDTWYKPRLEFLQKIMSL